LDTTKHKDGKVLAEQLFSEILGKAVKRVTISYKACASLDFGKDVTVEVKTKKGIDQFTRGEWCFWLYDCAWRLDKGEESLVASGDSPEAIKTHFPSLEGKRLLNAKILSSAFDLWLEFEDSFRLIAFTDTVEDSEPWNLSTQHHIFKAGHDKTWSYKKYE